MRVILDRGDLLKALNFQVAKDSKTISDIFSWVNLSSDSNSLRLRSINGEQSCETCIQAEVLSPGSATVKYKLFLDLVKEFMSREVVIELSPQDQKLVIMSGKSKYRLNVFNSEGVYDFSYLESGKLFSLSNFEIKKILSITGFIIKGDLISDDLNKILITPVGKNSVEIVSTDATRLSIINLSGVSISVDEPLALGANGVDAIKGFCSNLDDEDVIDFLNSDKYVILKTDEVTLSLLKAPSKFPNYRPIIQSSFENKVCLNVSEFDRALKRLLAISDETRNVKISFKKNSVVLYSHSATAGDGEDEIDAEVKLNSKVDSIIFDCRFLMDFFKLGQTNDQATIEFKDAESVARFSVQSLPDSFYYLMPKGEI